MNNIFDEIKRFASTLNGNPEQMGRQALAGMNEREVEEIRKQTDDIYQMLQKIGLMK